jgi:hypothetical protein
MSADHERMAQLLSGGGSAFRTSELQRAFEFHDLLKRREPSLYRYLREAMLGKKPAEVSLGDRGVEVADGFELGLTATYEHPAVEEDRQWIYAGRAFALCVEGGELKGNVSVEKLRVLSERERRKREWKLVTNEAWPTRVIAFTKRRKPLGAELHLGQLMSIARDEGVEVAEERLKEVLFPLDARLTRIFRAIRGKGR